MFCALADVVANVNHVEKFLCDYERAVHNVVEERYPNAAISGCLFHFKQAIYSNMKKKNCLPVFNNVPAFRTVVNNIYALAFVPPKEISDIWESVILPLVAANADNWTAGEKEEGYQTEVKEFLDYIEYAWIGRKVRIGRKPPLYDTEMWSKWSEVVSEDFTVTNNGNEVFNSTWNPSLPKSASLWTVIDCFKKEDALASITFSEAIRGVHVAHNRSRDEQHQNKMVELHNICLSYDKYILKQDYLDVIVKVCY